MDFPINVPENKLFLRSNSLVAKMAFHEFCTCHGLCSETILKVQL